MIPTDWTIRQALRDIIAAADTTAVVLPKFVLDVIVGENANLLKPTSGADAGKIHGWMIGDPQESNTRVGSVRQFDDDSITDNTSWRLDTVLTYPIWALHYYQLGDESAGTDSTKLFVERRAAVVEKFARKPRLGVAGAGCGNGLNQIKQHREMQLTREVDIVAMGADWAHFAPYELRIELYRTPAG